jgi:glycosyltransferase involved in cell wall biosynthesis
MDPHIHRYSIILPVKNGGSYLKECVNSILSQSFGGFNLHVLDNNSDDGSLQWVKSLKDDRIKLYSSEVPLTMEENWGSIVSIPKNEFMTMIGHDDILDREYLSVINKLILKHPGASLYQTHFKYIDVTGSTIRHCKPMDEVQSASEFLASFLASTIDAMGTGFMMRSSDYNAYGGIPFYPNLLFADFELWIRLAAKSYKATATEECFCFRLHQSATTKSPDVKFHLAFDQFIKFLMELKRENADFDRTIEKYSLDFITFYCKSLSHRLLRTANNKRNGLTVSSFLKSCKEYADMLAPQNNFHPCDTYSVKLARQIDSNFFTRSLFLLFKKIKRKPILP